MGLSEALIAVDLQNDFCPGGALAVPDGDAVVPIVNDLARRFTIAVFTQDWHPGGHVSFAAAHPGRKPFESIDLPYGPQVLWPAHCVQGTPGADFHPGIDVREATLVIRKGWHPGIDSYSTFFENDHTTSTGLAGYLRDLGVRTVYLAGLATDFCVAWSALDARRLGFNVTVVEDACRAIDLNGSLAAAREQMATAGVHFVSAASLIT